MKTLKTLALISFTFLAVNLFAQGGNMDPQQMAQKRTAQIKAKVTGISSDQESQILAIEQDNAKSMQAARSANNGDKEAMHSQMQTLRADRDAKIKGVLTADQYTQYTQMEQENQKQMHNKGGN